MGNAWGMGGSPASVIEGPAKKPGWGKEGRGILNDMLKIAREKIFFGDFHGQWNEDQQNPSLLLAGLNYYGYDFTVFQGPGDTSVIERMADQLETGLIETMYRPSLSITYL